MDIQTASLGDLTALRRLEKICFEQDAWPILDLIGVLTWPDIIRLKAVEAGRMIGFIAGDPRQGAGVMWIATVGVDPGFQRRGVGTALIQACEARAKTSIMKLTVRASNHEAMALYEKLGYRTIDIWPGYYRDGEDGLVMYKNL